MKSSITYSSSLFCLILLFLLFVSGAIDLSTATIEEAPFLSEEQKADIFSNNAARFLRLSEKAIARHHAMVSEAEGER